MTTDACLAVSNVAVGQIIAMGLNCPITGRMALLQQLHATAEKKRLAYEGLPAGEYYAITGHIQACGKDFKYRSWLDVPLVDTPCPCGDPTHWIARWYDTVLSASNDDMSEKTDAKPA